jgi:hypothetical protein
MPMPLWRREYERLPNQTRYNLYYVNTGRHYREYMNVTE